MHTDPAFNRTHGLYLRNWAPPGQVFAAEVLSEEQIGMLQSPMLVRAPCDPACLTVSIRYYFVVGLGVCGQPAGRLLCGLLRGQPDSPAAAC